MFYILLLLMISGFSSAAHADVYVITAPDKSVYSISEQDDAVVPNGYKKSVLPGKKIQDLTVSMGEEKMYDFNGSKFTLNAAKVTEKNKAEEDAIKEKQKLDSDRLSAITKLKGLGLTDDEIKALHL